MFTKTQAHKIKNCDKKMATKKARERNVERLKNNTKRSKKKMKIRSKTTFALLKQRHKTKTKTDTRNGCKVYSSKAEGEVGRGCSRRDEEGRGGERTAAAPQSKETKSLLNAKSGKN